MKKAPQRNPLQGLDLVSGADRDRTGDPCLQTLSRRYRSAKSVATRRPQLVAPLDFSCAFVRHAQLRRHQKLVQFLREWPLDGHQPLALVHDVWCRSQRSEKNRSVSIWWPFSSYVPSKSTTEQFTVHTRCIKQMPTQRVRACALLRFSLVGTAGACRG
jgi:hypothetical protein